MLVGYARVSTIDQNIALQMDALRSTGCEKIFTEKASGSHRDRPQLKAALDYLRTGDTLVVWKLSRLARSLTQVIKTAADIHERGIALKVLTQNIDTSTSEGRLYFHMTAAFDEFQRERYYGWPMARSCALRRLAADPASFDARWLAFASAPGRTSAMTATDFSLSVSLLFQQLGTPCKLRVVP